jgi:hypothetical protein
MLILIYKNDINCAIFRHGIFINSLLQIEPSSFFLKKKDNVTSKGYAG